MIGQNHELWDARFLSQIIDFMADGVFTLDADGHVSSWNPAMERISGYSSSDALGKTCGLLQCSRCFDRACPANLNECGILSYGEAMDSECMVRHKEGHDVPVIKNARAVYDDHGGIIGVVETLTDLTELKQARQKAEDAASRLRENHRFDNIIGRSRVMQQVFTDIKVAADSYATILINGESGTGKELVAGAIHYNSPLSASPMVTVNCSALSESLLESELFGHVRGAFTGAVRDRKGRFEEADGGTIFLDEIGEISPLIQVKLLRVLQEREIERVGESRRRKINIRIIAATHQDLYELMQAGRFREDLYYRLKVFPIQLPPLRQRKEDIPLLIRHFIRKQNKIIGKEIRGVSSTAMRILMDHSWPGNVRELENAIEHAFVLREKGDIDVFDLPVEIRQMKYQPPARRESTPSKRGKRLTKSVLTQILTECDWNKAEVGRQVGLSRTAIWKYMKKWDIPLKSPLSGD
ncbi:MAG: diguanylate cyclase [Deltaproteobacteria bacterium]|nr:MAG: diguanylate cyclase [Deltaproteobacteria bacterium]